MALKSLLLITCLVVGTQGYALIAGRFQRGLPYYLKLPDNELQDIGQEPKVGCHHTTTSFPQWRPGAEQMLCTPVIIQLWRPGAEQVLCTTSSFPQWWGKTGALYPCLVVKRESTGGSLGDGDHENRGLEPQQAQ